MQLKRDIVLRLIEAAEKAEPDYGLFLEAADEIDRLEKRVKELEAALTETIHG